MKFKLIRIKNRLNLSSDSRLYARPCFAYKLGKDELVKQIASCSSVNAGDIKSMLANIAEIIPSYLSEGCSVELAGIGVISFSFSSTGITDPSQFVPSLIRKKHIRFRPSPELIRQIEQHLSFELIKEAGPERKKDTGKTVQIHPS